MLNEAVTVLLKEAPGLLVVYLMAQMFLKELRRKDLLIQSLLGHTTHEEGDDNAK
jgi:hypothetical protein